MNELKRLKELLKNTQTPEIIKEQIKKKIKVLENKQIVKK